MFQITKQDKYQWETNGENTEQDKGDHGNEERLSSREGGDDVSAQSRIQSEV